MKVILFLLVSSSGIEFPCRYVRGATVRDGRPPVWSAARPGTLSRAHGTISPLWGVLAGWGG